jgi:hypothetical protein
MAMKLRITFTVLSALCVAAIIPVGAIVSWTAAIFCMLGAFLFFGLMMICKLTKGGATPTEPKNAGGDFFHPANEKQNQQPNETANNNPTDEK